MIPKYLYRPSDGERFTLQDDGKYTMDSSRMGRPYRDTYDTLRNLHFTSNRPVIDRGEDPVELDYKWDGHDVDYEDC